MDPKVIYWTAALAHMTLLLGCAVAGWRAIRRGDVARHRLLMSLAVWLVGIFVLSYVGKLVWLGKEDLSRWTRADVWILRIHETLVLAMVLAGTVARVLARTLDRRAGRPARLEAAALAGLGDTRRRHRWAGRVAIVAGVWALLTASLILWGMYGRLG